jgi:hypothetical protein
VRAAIDCLLELKHDGDGALHYKNVWSKVIAKLKSYKGVLLLQVWFAVRVVP